MATQEPKSYIDIKFPLEVLTDISTFQDKILHSRFMRHTLDDIFYHLTFPGCLAM